MRDLRCKGTVYVITNLVNGKVYVGQTINTVKRRYDGANFIGDTHNDYLRNAINKYGIENFAVEEVVGCLNREELNTMERYYIALTQATNRDYGYNRQSGGNNATFNDDVRRKMSESQRKKHVSDETKAKMRASNRSKEFAQPHTKITKISISLGKGCKPFDVFKKKTGEYVGTWISRTLCATDLNLDPYKGGCAIASCLLHPKRHKSYKGYTFKEKE